jgi:murein DD-endopeptidase MepM/ murein hydrolase activator NlpD
MENQNQKLIKKLKNRYRLVIINDKTFEDKFSVSLTPLNLFVVFSSFLVFFTVIIVLVIVYTPLREFIPGYTDSKTKNQVISLIKRSDSLEYALYTRNEYYLSVLNILRDELDDTISTPPPQSSVQTSTPSARSKKEEEFVKEFESSRDDYSTIKRRQGDPTIQSFYKPVDGVVSKTFNRLDHPAIDIVSNPNQPVKSIQDGRIIFSGWTKESGYVLAIQHANNLVSIYKHNASNLKKYGTFVRAGETIAIVGNSGEHTSGPHLHLEIWDNGYALNPELLFNY